MIFDKSNFNTFITGKPTAVNIPPYPHVTLFSSVLNTQIQIHCKQLPGNYWRLYAYVMKYIFILMD